MRPTSLAASCVAIVASLSSAQLSAQEMEQAPAEVDEEILVVAERIRGQVDTDQPPIIELNEAEIASYGADSLADLVAQLAPQTGSGRGRGGRPVFLINGQRVSGFREFRRYPPEAIRKVEVLPEEVATKFGYPADQRVINFILKDNFSSREIEAEYGGPTDGGSASGELEGSMLVIDGPRRINVGAEFNTSSMLTEDERNIVQTDIGLPRVATDPDPAAFRSLVADSESVELEATVNSGIGEGGMGGNISLNGNFTSEYSRSLSGLDTVVLTDPAGNSALRTLDDDPLERLSHVTTMALGSTLNKPLGDWQLSATLDASRTRTVTLIDQRRDTTELQDLAAAGLLAIDGPLPPVAAAGQDRARTNAYDVSSLFTLMGNPILLPGGDVSVTFDAGYTWDRIASTDTRSALGEVELTRGDLSAGVNLGIPITSRREGFLDAVGDVSLSLGGGVNHLSDFGTLADWNARLNWSPVERLTLLASYTYRELAPGLGQLGNPQIVTFNVPVYDFTNGETVLATITSGGNPALQAETQRDIKLSATYDFDLFDRANILVEYYKNNSDNVTESFPLLTPAIEAAYPDRVTRDAAGRLVAIDRTPVTFAERKSDRLRYGFNVFGRIGKAQPQGGGGAPADPAGQPRGNRGPGAGGPPSEEQRARFAEMREKLCAMPDGELPDLASLPQPMQERLAGADGQLDPQKFAAFKQRVCSADGPPAGAGAGAGGASGGSGQARGGGMPGFGRGGDGQGRWNLSAYHTIEFNNTALVAVGGPQLDLLGGDALGSSATPRHTFQLEGGGFYKGVGLRMSANYTGKARVNGSGLAGSNDLFFDDRLTVDARLFVNLEEQAWLAGDNPGFLKGMRMSLRASNLFNERQRVVDQNGVVPVSYQPGLLNPVGRSVEIEFRKIF